MASNWRLKHSAFASDSLSTIYRNRAVFFGFDCLTFWQNSTHVQVVRTLVSLEELGDVVGVGQEVIEDAVDLGLGSTESLQWRQ